MPISIHKEIHQLTEMMSAKAIGEEKAQYKTAADGLPHGELRKIIDNVEQQMKQAAKNLEFERAAALRDELYDLKNLLAEDESLKPWERIKLMTGEE
jgi:excinuclease ABC subunit B